MSVWVLFFCFFLSRKEDSLCSFVIQQSLALLLWCCFPSFCLARFSSFCLLWNCVSFCKSPVAQDRSSHKNCIFWWQRNHSREAWTQLDQFTNQLPVLCTGFPLVQIFKTNKFCVMAHRNHKFQCHPATSLEQPLTDLSETLSLIYFLSPQNSQERCQTVHLRVKNSDNFGKLLENTWLQNRSHCKNYDAASTSRSSKKHCGQRLQKDPVNKQDASFANVTVPITVPYPPVTKKTKKHFIHVTR